MLKHAWALLKGTASEFMADEALSSGAAIAFYTITSLAPVLVIVIGVAGLVFGHDAAQGAIVDELRGLMGQQSADMIQSAVASASGKAAGIIATLLGGLTLIVTASGVFGEMQTALNKIWKAKSDHGTVGTLVRARAASLGLVFTLGFLLLVSLAASAAITALSDIVDSYIPFGRVILMVVNFVISFTLVSVLFGAIYKVLPDRALQWRDVAVGAVATAALFTIGKTAIGAYLGSSTVASSYGAAGGLIVALLWVYYSAQIFLLGAEFTKVYAVTQGSHQGSNIAPAAPAHASGAGAAAAPAPVSGTAPPAGAATGSSVPRGRIGPSLALAVGAAVLIGRSIQARRTR